MAQQVENKKTWDDLDLMDLIVLGIVIGIVLSAMLIPVILLIGGFVVVAKIAASLLK